MEKNTQNRSVNYRWKQILVLVILILILICGAYLRLVGVNWDENQHMHPDERFLSLVQAAISPVDDVSTYFNTAESTLNPANRGYTFFVYGTLPIFIIRYLGEALGQTDYHSITLLGRQVSAVFDIFTILLVFMVGKRLYNRWVGLIGAGFYAMAVLPIQLSHFMTVDTATNTFAFLAVYGAVWALTRDNSDKTTHQNGNKNLADSAPVNDEAKFLTSPDNFHQILWLLIELAPYILFGAALGAATASKINAIVLAMVLPLVECIRYSKMSSDERNDNLILIFRNLLVAGVLSFLVFRVGQPYAFNGPSFFNFGIDENWWASMQSLRSQASGAVDFPPALQWARRPITFSMINLVAWGLGWPLGLAAWGSFVGMGILILKRIKWQKHLPLWLFTGFYFVWQSLSWVRTMRYQMLIYPALALFAGWGIVSLISITKLIKIGSFRIPGKYFKTAGIVLLVIIISTTAAWAFAFSRIYTRPHTRVEASRWIYQNVPGALTLNITTQEGYFRQPLPYRAGDSFYGNEYFSLPFISSADGVITQVNFPYMLDQSQADAPIQVYLSVISSHNPELVLATSGVESYFLPTENEWRGDSYDFILNPSIQVQEGELYYLKLELSDEDAALLLHGSPTLLLTTAEGMVVNSPLPRIMQSVRLAHPYVMNVQVLESGWIKDIDAAFVADLAGIEGVKDLSLSLRLADDESQIYTATLQSAFSIDNEIRGDQYRFSLQEPLSVEAGQTLVVNLSTETENVRLSLNAPAPVHESSWDDAIPYPVDGFSPYSETGGIYRPDLNFEMYWADDPLKLEKFERNLDLADFVFITSNRQWGTTTRVPERYLLTTHYYRQLLGCPPVKEVTWCYSVAEPGMFEGNLGFELTAVFHSNPNIGPIEFNTQFAEEAFTVYDHPKVLIFRKADTYDSVHMREVLREVDLSQVVYFTPGEAAAYQSLSSGLDDDPRPNLMLPEDRLMINRAGGTWSELFDLENILNNNQVVAAVVFYLFVTLLGWVSYPLIRLGLPGLADRGYPFSKLAGLLLLTLVVWLLGSFKIPVTTILILAVLAGILLLSGLLMIVQRENLWDEIKTRWRYYLIVEVLAAIAFVSFLLIRWGNPDLWHPFKGGEKPMDFAYLNAVIKSTTFPPFDPWFAGGYINYYYFGFVIVGLPIKLLGILPSTAYNLVLPLWFSLMIIGSFSIGWNLYQCLPKPQYISSEKDKPHSVLNAAFWVGLATAIGLGVLGNLGTVRLILNGYQRIAAGGLPLDQATFGQQIIWTIQGLVQVIQGVPLPFYPGDWYWVPSRVIPGEAITEFPFFTFIYADLHAHLIALPITIFAVGWSLSVILNKAQWGEKDGKNKWIGAITGFILGGIVIGSLRPTNTWDYYTYLVLGLAAVGYSVFKNYLPRFLLDQKSGIFIEKIIAVFISGLLLAGLSNLFYRPFDHWFGQAYTQVGIWEGSRTPLGSYLTHWGLFLFIICSWMCLETYHWMKTTPGSSLKKLEPYQGWLISGFILFCIFLIALLVSGVVVAMIVLPLGLWTIILMIKPGRSDGERFLLFMIGSALTLTLVVELFHLVGDIGRMNTVFKIYLQAWVLFALSAGICFGWVIKSIKFWRRRFSLVWQVVLLLLVASAAMFTLTGTSDKIRDRMAPEAPNTLDGMAYMAYATYFDTGEAMHLVEDYHAINWMQDHIIGSPVIVEGQAYEYRWGNRFSIYTGLPGVVGWNWHQRQQRAVLRSNAVQDRVNAVNNFYNTENLPEALEFLELYDVEFIVLGQLEQLYYPGAGLDKFELHEGQYWEIAYQYGSTIIYRVLQ